MIFGTWNVRTLVDIDSADRPERRRALVSKEQARVNVDIAALSETWLSGEGSFEETGSGYTFFWKGKNEGERRIQEAKSLFYQQLSNITVNGNFDARVGKSQRLWENVSGKEGVGNCNSNGHLLLSLCIEHNLSITNTKFRLPTRFKTIWMHPRYKHWHLIVYTIIRQKDKRCNPLK
uniref:Endonuclease/exonuclease/phosphatase domain-containing protein n=1 Tax=Octopus bimaculoides TaxID=37653 RepID=A0A0L8HZ16_OCTBM